MVMRHRVARVEPKSGAKSVYGLADPGESGLRDTKMEIGVGRLLAAERTCDQLGRNLVIAARACEDPKQMQRVGIPRVGLQHPPVPELRLGKTPRAVILRGLFQDSGQLVKRPLRFRHRTFLLWHLLAGTLMQPAGPIYFHAPKSEAFRLF
jgi:hypothetical protein